MQAICLLLLLGLLGKGSSCLATTKTTSTARSNETDLAGEKRKRTYNDGPEKTWKMESEYPHKKHNTGED